MKKELYLGLDVHKDCILTASLRKAAGAKCAIAGRSATICRRWKKWIGRLRKAHGKETRLRACYEAGPCGFGIARRLRS